MTDIDSAPEGPSRDAHDTEFLGAPTAPRSEPHELPPPPPAETAPDPMIGLLVDSRYRISRRLARGGMATVYLAKDERLDRPVALKIMHPHLAESADFVARFRREARAAARIIHPGVVSVFDQGVIHGQGFLVMEYIEGPNLRTLLRAEGAFTVEETLRYLRDVLDALRAAHRVGVIHRDIKPENVLVPADPPARVTDFGLARAASEVSLSSTGSMLGTVAYIAPEIALARRIDERADIYAVGIMAYEMLTGSVPWEGETALAIASHHVNDPIPLPSSAVPWLPREVDDLVASLAALDPDDRPADAAEALDRVARAAAAIPPDIGARRAQVLPKDPSPIGETSAWERSGVTSSLPERLPASSRTVVRASGAAPAPAPKRKRHRSVGKILALLAALALVASGGGWWWWSEYGPGSYIEMPTTVSRPAQAVESELTALGLGILAEEAYSDTVPEGQVISSDPAGGQRVHKDAEVRIVVSKGVEMKTVPDLVGSTAEEAASALTTAGLALGTTSEEYSEEVAAGVVLSQAVAPDTSIPHDTAVDLVVSKGREPIEVPDLAGSTAEEAKAAIEALGLVAAPTQAYSDTVAAGSVLSQATAAGETLHRGDSVSYVVSLGPEMVEVPSVQGKQESQAIAALEAAGLKVEVERILGGVFGTARSTDPGAGESVKKGSTVTLYVV